jgi:hypothetical protein
VKETLEALRGQEGSAARPLQSLAIGEGGLTTAAAIGGAIGTTATAARKLSIGVVGFGKFGQFIAKTFAKHHSVRAMGRSDTSAAAKALGCRCVTLYFLLVCCYCYCVCIGALRESCKHELCYLHLVHISNLLRRVQRKQRSAHLVYTVFIERLYSDRAAACVESGRQQTYTASQLNVQLSARC